MEIPALTLDRVEHNLDRIQLGIQRAAERANRDANAVRIVAVTKGFPAAVVRLAAQAGLHRIGENRVEEAERKRPQVSDVQGLQWHMVGHLQSRKAGRVPGLLDVVHSVDRSKIADRLDRRAGEAGLRLPVLLQCNTSGEAAKGGWELADPAAWPAIVPEFRQIEQLPHLEVLGLMTMAPLGGGEPAVLETFGKLRRLAAFLREHTPGAWGELSMGMSDDYQAAVLEGATLLRIGRALFGPRPEGA